MGDQSPEVRLTPTQVVAEFLALSVVESTFSPGLAVHLTVSGRDAMISDDGRGIQLRPDPGDLMSHAERALTSPYPVHSSHAEVNALLEALVWGERGSVGPSLANRNCERLQYWSRRGGEEWTQEYRNGVALASPTFVGAAQTSGTTLRFTTSSDIDVASVAGLVAALSAVRSVSIAFGVDAGFEDRARAAKRSGEDD